MDTARCPACNAWVAPGAPWCTLCFADLRPKPEPIPVPAAAPELLTQQSLYELPVAHTLPTPPEPLPPVPVALSSAPLPTYELPAAAVAVAEPATKPTTDGAEPTWPCTICSAKVAMSESICTECGAMFLAGGDVSASLIVPVVGDLAKANTGTRMMVGLVAAVGLTAALLIIAFVLGHVL